MDQMVQIGLDEQGRILIPASERAHVQLEPGMTLMVEDAEGGGLRLSVEQESPSVAVVDGMLVAIGEPLADLQEIVRRERDQRVAELVQQTGL